MTGYLLLLAGILFTYMMVWYAVSIVKKRNDVADIAWGSGFVLLAIVSLFLANSIEVRSLIVTSLVLIWGVRLSIHIFFRNKGKKEDYRYDAWRRAWGKAFYFRSFLQVFVLQGLLLFLIVLPVLLINKSGEAGFYLLDYLGISIWMAGFFFEVVGDHQLSKFIKNPKNKGKLMQEGLWKYTRHPNYFGEVTLWWGIWIMAFSAGVGFWSIFAPLTITVLILKISGIPMLEKKMQEHPDFKEYSKKTSVFFPLPRK